MTYFPYDKLTNTLFLLKVQHKKYQYSNFELLVAELAVTVAVRVRHQLAPHLRLGQGAITPY